jgi:hypothetical protein
MKSYIGILFLGIISFINCSDHNFLPPSLKLKPEADSLLLLSPSKLEKEDDLVRRALEHLSPLKGQTVEEAYYFYLETYANSPYNRVYLTEQQEKDEIKKIEESYKLLTSCGLKDATRDYIESRFTEKSDLLNTSFASSQLLSSILSPASHSCPSLSSSLSASFASRSQGSSAVVSPQEEEGYTPKSMFKNEDDVLRWLGLKPNQAIDTRMMESIAYRISQLDVSNAIGEVTDEDFFMAKRVFERLEE